MRSAFILVLYHAVSKSREVLGGEVPQRLKFGLMDEWLHVFPRLLPVKPSDCFLQFITYPFVGCLQTLPNPWPVLVYR